jgi:hypothetical protein
VHWALLNVLADDQPAPTDQWSHSLKNAIFMGVFFMALIIVGIWWLRR